eukprot:gene18468-21025_t
MGGTNGLGAANNSSAYSSELTPERAQFWINWLESHGCLAVSYHHSMKLKEYEVLGDNKSTSKYAALHQTEGTEEEEVDLESGITNSGINKHTNAYVNISTSIDDDDSNSPAVNESNSNSNVNTDTNEVNSMFARNMEMDFCSICLNPFECASNTSNTNIYTLPTSGDVGDLPASLVNGGVSNSNAICPAPPNVVVENNNVIVRYPCRGRHYFHAHCLHSWLQVSSARYLNQVRRPGVLPASPELLQDTAARQVTCPCCREHPPALEPSTVPSSFPASNNGLNVNSVQVVHTVEITRRP